MAAAVAPGLPPVLEGLVEDGSLHNPNYLTLNRVYSKVGVTRILQADPAVLHFGGYTVGQVLRQTLRVRNVKASGTRIHILPPSTPFFKATCDAKKGLLAAGMSDEITIEFFPQQYRYYYDCIRIHSEEENLLIPIHAYPSTNQAAFPTRVDFGRCALGEEVSRTVALECRVPVEFEFEIVEVSPHPSFKVEPMSGVVPANGSVPITLSFCPLAMATEEMTIEVRVAEFNSKPVVCRIVGSGAPGVVKDRLIRETLKGTAARDVTMDMLDGTRDLAAAAKSMPVNPGGGRLRGGAGNGDAYTVAQATERLSRTTRDCRTTGPIKAVLPAPPSKAGESPVNGIYVPDTMLMTTGDIAYVLNQSPGKLRIKDVKEAILTKKASTAAQQAALGAVLSEGISEGLHPLERPDIPPDVKAALFRMQLHQAEEAAKKVSLGTSEHLGEELLAECDIAKAQALRASQRRAHAHAEEAKAARRLVPELQPTGALHLPSPAGGAGGGGAAEAFRPEWRVIEGSDWPKRTRVLDMFMKAVWRVVYAMRLRRRLERIKHVLGQLGHDKQRLAEEAANPTLLLTESDRPGTAPTKHLRPEAVRVRPLPLYRECLFSSHEAGVGAAVPQSTYTDFDELAPFSAKPPLEYKLLGYTAEDIPGLTCYLPPLLDQPLLEGAPEELGLGGAALVPSGTVPPLSDYPPLPDACKQMPYITLEIGNRYSDDKVVAMPEPSWGMDAGYLVQPRIYPLHDSGAHEALPSGGVRAMRGVASLAVEGGWAPRRDAWGVQIADEVVPALMSGPDPSDLLEDSPGDEDKPGLAPRVPTLEELQQYLPKLARNGAPQGQQGAQAAAARFRLVRQQAVEALEAGKAAAHEGAIAGLEARLAEYNATLARPCHFALHL